MDIRVKERLTGAVILVALLVLLVPELLTGPRGSATAPAAVEQGPLRSYTIELGERPRASGRAEPRPDEPVQPAPPGAASDDGVPHVAGSTSSRASAQGSPPAARSAPGGEPSSGTPGRSASAPAAARNEPVADTQPATVMREPPAAAPVREAPAAGAARPPAPEAGWSVQVGSFASRDNATRLARELQGRGFAARVTEGRSSGRTLYRVRVGPVADREDAQALAARLRAAGQSAAALVPHP